ncbi:MAG TPA: di-heme oxidoredictase family protein [Alphaproteobacteria bacterium]|nr:di-heme oxidoredictase family protein [Alphaproteobacteria bacterium]
MLRTPLAIALSAAFVAPAVAGAVTFITRPPWDPARMPVSVDQSQLQGELSAAELQALIEAGQLMFTAKFSAADGQGRPTATQAMIPTHFKHPRELSFQRASGPDANSCTTCHNVPSTGGSGDFTNNAFTSEGTESADFDSVDPQFSNERNPPVLFGAGLKELLAREMTRSLQAIRDKAVEAAASSGQAVTAHLTTKGIDFGTLIANPDGTLDMSQVEGIDRDLIVRPFGWKGVFPSIRNFTVTALNVHIGLESDERFSMALTGEVDFDGDGKAEEATPGQVSALVAFEDSLPAPRALPFGNPDWDARAAAGRTLFDRIGCSSCHVAELPLHDLKVVDPGPYDTAGTLSSRDVEKPAIYDLGQLDWVKALPRDAAGDVLVPLFSDLKRHEIADTAHDHFANEVQSQAFVARDTFMTPALWAVADTAPYGHRGDLSTLQEVILAHGGEGRAARDAFAALSQDDQDDLITFLKTLRAPQ